MPGSGGPWTQQDSIQEEISQAGWCSSASFYGLLPVVGWTRVRDWIASSRTCGLRQTCLRASYRKHLRPREQWSPVTEQGRKLWLAPGVLGSPPPGRTGIPTALRLPQSRAAEWWASPSGHIWFIIYCCERRHWEGHTHLREEGNYLLANAHSRSQGLIAY